MTRRALLGQRTLHRHASPQHGQPELFVDLAGHADPDAPGASVAVAVVLNVQVDLEAWQQSYGPVEVSVADDVRRYVGGVLAGSEATRRGALVGVDVQCAPVLPTEDS